VIVSFADAETRKIYEGADSRKLPRAIQRAARRKLIQLADATDLRDLAAIPGNRLESLQSRRRGQHSIRVNDQYRVCFRWSQGDARDVEITDYH